MQGFPKDFLIGAATAAHQVEGNNTNSDCWALEHMAHSSYNEPSEDAVDHYHRYAQDIRLMAQAGLNAYRFSIEWARIEPQEGRFDAREIEHYRDVIRCCKENGIAPIVTLHHFSSPKWLISKGGWEADTTPADFARYVRYVIQHLGSELNYVCTINEANIGLQIAASVRTYMQKLQAENASNIQLGINAQDTAANERAAIRESMDTFGVEKAECFISPRTAHGDQIILDSHKAARAIIRETAPHIKVGFTLSLHDIQAVPGGEANAKDAWDEEFTHYLPVILEDDFLGVQNYTRTRMDADGAMPVPEEAELTQMGYEFYPEALENVIRAVHKDFPGDILVTEHGIATDDDMRRIAFIQKAMEGVQNCLNDGIPVKGYCHWSLLNNFEWQKGYTMKFGLIDVNRTTQIRCPKKSLTYLGSFRSMSVK